jgi:hypothetical protein
MAQFCQEARRCLLKWQTRARAVDGGGATACPSRLNPASCGTGRSDGSVSSGSRLVSAKHSEDHLLNLRARTEGKNAFIVEGDLFFAVSTRIKCLD